MTVRLLHGDCVELMRRMPDCSVDAVVTDPPYGLEFMGKDWDAPWKASEVVEVTDAATNGTFHTKGFKHGVRYSRGRQEMLAFQQWFTEVAAEALRVLKPGGHLLAFGGTRTYHRMACAIEDAGFEIRDSIHWVYGSGFPKSLNVGKAIDKAAGAEREVVGRSDDLYGRKSGIANGTKGHTTVGGTVAEAYDVTVPATEEAARWEGWGTALKPAHEPIVVARKPLSSTVAGNVLEYGTGGLNIDGCRVGTDTIMSRGGRSGAVTGDEREGAALGMYGAHEPLNTTHTGRWPANVVFDRAAGDALDQQSGVSKSPQPTGTYGTHEDTSGNAVYGRGLSSATPNRAPLGDSGGASRFFTQADWGPDDWPFVYQAKPSRKERNAGVNVCACDKLSATDKAEAAWDAEDRQAAHPEATEQSRQRATGASGTRNSSDTEWNTSSSGSSTTDPSPKGSRSTTATTTNSTTPSGTSNSSEPSSTSASTQAANSVTTNGGSPAPSAGNSSPSPTSTGTSAAKGGHSTDAADPATSAPSSSPSSSGVCARCGGVRGGHPTVKPVALMRHLVRLVTPPGGVVLDPFAGSGTTLVAAVLEGFDAVGCEMTEEYLPIIRGRVAWAEEQAAARGAEQATLL